MFGNTPSSNPEYPALLPPGRHELKLSELKKICVDDFPLSTSRLVIMEGLEKVIDKLKSCFIQGEIWINGSFVTNKIDPNDVDLVLRTSAQFLDNANPDQRNTVDWLSSNLKTAFHCDSYVFSEWPVDHKNYLVGKNMHDYWTKLFGFSRGGSPKGIIVISL